MDSTTNRLADFAADASYDALSPAVIHECKRRLVDTFACAFGAYHEPLCVKARTLAQRYMGTPSATIWGSTQQSSPEMAAFANGITLRYLDYSDTYLSKSSGHPSDLIAALIAAGEAVQADGRAIINAITLAYDIYCTFQEAIAIHPKGWDQATYMVMASALGTGKLLGLSRDQLANALSLALAPNLHLHNVRQGELSEWKGCAGANAARNGLFAAFLARDGFTGPTGVFEGGGGLFSVVGKFDWQVAVDRERPHRVAMTDIKYYPICYHGLSAVTAALQLRPRVTLDAVKDVAIEIYQMAVLRMGNDPARWAPATRETADHSLPFCVATALLDGEVTPASFATARLTDPTLKALMNKVRVIESDALSARYPASAPCRMTISLTSGESVSTEVEFPKGHQRNPLSDAELEHKFRVMFMEYGDAQQGEAILDVLWKFNEMANVKTLLNLIVRGNASDSRARLRH
jgi:2-methylcitrate dehydratase